MFKTRLSRGNYELYDFSNEKCASIQSMALYVLTRATNSGAEHRLDDYACVQRFTLAQRASDGYHLHSAWLTEHSTPCRWSHETVLVPTDVAANGGIPDSAQ